MDVACDLEGGKRKFQKNRMPHEKDVGENAECEERPVEMIHFETASRMRDVPSFFDIEKTLAVAGGLIFISISKLK